MHHHTQITSNVCVCVCASESFIPMQCLKVKLLTAPDTNTTTGTVMASEHVARRAAASRGGKDMDLIDSIRLGLTSALQADRHRLKLARRPLTNPC